MRILVEPPDVVAEMAAVLRLLRSDLTDAVRCACDLVRCGYRLTEIADHLEVAIAHAMLDRCGGVAS
jgi:hypothetical protein